MKFFAVLALLATTNALTLKRTNPNGGDVTLGGEKVAWPPAPVATSEAIPRDGSAVDASKNGKQQHDDAVNS